MKITVSGVEFEFETFPTPDELAALKAMADPIPPPPPPRPLPPPPPPPPPVKAIEYAPVDGREPQMEFSDLVNDDGFIAAPIVKIRRATSDSKWRDLNAQYVIDIQEVLRFGGWYRCETILNRLHISAGSTEAQVVSNTLDRLKNNGVIVSRKLSTRRYEYAHTRYAKKFPKAARRYA